MRFILAMVIMMNLSDLRQSLVEQSGQRGLVTDAPNADYSDKSGLKTNATYYLNSGLRWLNQRYGHQGSYRRTQVPLEAGQYFVAAPGARNIKRIDYLDSNGTRVRLQYRPEAWMRDYYNQDFPEITPDAPVHWTWYTQAENEITLTAGTGIEFEADIDSAFAHTGVSTGVRPALSAGVVYGVKLSSGDFTIVRGFDLATGEEVYELNLGSDDAAHALGAYGGALYLIRRDGTGGDAGGYLRNVTSGTEVTLDDYQVSAQTYPQLAVDANYVWANWEKSGGTYLYRYTRALGGETQITALSDSNSPGLANMYSNGTYLFVNTGGTVKRLNIATSAVDMIIPQPDSNTYICGVDSDHIYWSTNSLTEARIGVSDLSGGNFISLAISSTAIDTAIEDAENVSVLVGHDGSAVVVSTNNDFTQLNITASTARKGRGILILPPAEQDYTLQLFGDFHVSELVDDSDTNWWTEAYPEHVIRAARLQLELDGHRNISGVDAFQTKLEGEIDWIVANDRFAHVAGFTPEEACQDG